VYGFQLCPNVLRRTSWTRVKLEASKLSGLVETRLLKGHCKGFEEFLIRGGEAIVDFVA